MNYILQPEILRVISAIFQEIGFSTPDFKVCLSIVGTLL
jgi:hypothetical protein